MKVELGELELGGRCILSKERSLLERNNADVN